MTPTILTRSGLQLNLLRPDPACIHLEDIAHALGNLCRFTGHTSAHDISQAAIDAVRNFKP